MNSLSLSKSIVERGGKGFVELSVAEKPLPTESELEDDQLLVAIEAAPINPSDIGPIFAPSYGGIGRFDGIELTTDAAGRSVAVLPVPDKTFAGMKGTRAVGRAVKLGNEGAGRVILAGKSAAAQRLKGKLVAAMGMGGSYAQHGSARHQR